MLRNTTVLFAAAVGALVVALFTLKHEVRALEEQVRRLDRAIGEEQQAIHVLKAEWSHLNDPARLRDLAKRHLNMEPVDLARMQRLSRFAESGLLLEPPPSASHRAPAASPGPVPSAAPARSTSTRGRP